MVSTIIEYWIYIINFAVDTLGYAGVFGLMLLEGFSLPISSMAIMLFCGFLVSQGELPLVPTLIAGAVGNTVGAVGLYYLAAIGGRPLVEKYGKYILISRRDLNTADRWFARHGNATVFFSRLIPTIRTYASLPAGVANMNVGRFFVYTLAGSVPWCLFWLWLGVRLGDNWQQALQHLGSFDLIITAAVVVAAAWYVWRHFKYSP